MHRELLELTVDVMEHVAAARKPFNMDSWYAPNDAEPCKTAACGFGYAALDPRLQAHGLSFEASYEGERRAIKSIREFNDFIKTLPNDVDMDYVEMTPTFNGEYDLYAAVEFYDISWEAAEYLFIPGTYSRNNEGEITPKMVIERIKEVISLNGERPYLSD